MSKEFFNIYNHGFARVAVATPHIRIADPAYNAGETLKLAYQAQEQGAVLVAFPELGLTGYTCDDLFRQEALLDGAEKALISLIEASRDMNITMIVGLPLRVNHQLFNVAAVVADGELQGVVPKMFLPNYGEFYEARYFAPADSAVVESFIFNDAYIPFGTQLLFELPHIKNFKFNIEICEDVWTPLPPSTLATLAGATVLINLSASNALVGKSGYRHDLVAQQSARCLAAYLYTSAGAGESTTDLAWDGQSLVYEKGDLLVEAERFQDTAQIKFADIDLDRLIHDRIKTTTFSDSVRHYAPMLEGYRTFSIFTKPVNGVLDLDRYIEAFPFVPADPKVRDVRCTEVYNIQVQALTQRMAATNIKKLVIGVSGGLDSTHALLVCVAAMDRLSLPRTNILGYTMPGFATSGRTLKQAHALMNALGITAKEVDIKPSCIQMLKDLDHPFARGEEVYDITFENVQAGERTNHLFRYANHHNAMVVGTGDLSELALGWCTYGVGDHMSHYNVNGSVPKTLMQYLVRWVAESDNALALTDEAAQVLIAILETEISPELIPTKAGEDEAPTQSTESSIGPYELQDFTLHYVLRYGFKPSKIAYLAFSAWGHKYSLADIKKYMQIFMFRFFQISQFKRTCVPNGPKVGNGGSLSPRGDWRAPSDSVATVWLEDMKNIPDNV